MSQFAPDQPGRQSHKYPPIRLRQERALTHTPVSHSLVSEEEERSDEVRLYLAYRHATISAVYSMYNWQTLHMQYPDDLQYAVYSRT